MSADAEPEIDAISFLEAQHADIRRLFNQVQQAGVEAKAEAFQCLVRLLAVHETAEEEVLHPIARRAEGGEVVVEQRLQEESSAKQALADLEELGAEHPEFDERLDAFRRAVDEHAHAEETQELPLVRASTTWDEMTTMTEQLRIAEKVAPTHPHPHGPDGAVGNLLVGPFVAIADRVRDAMKGN